MFFYRDSFKKLNEKRIKELQKHQSVEQIIKIREQSIQIRY